MMTSERLRDAATRTATASRQAQTELIEEMTEMRLLTFNRRG